MSKEGGGGAATSEPDGGIPGWQELFGPVVGVLSDGAVSELPVLAEAVGDRLGLDSKSRGLRFDSGRPILATRIRWVAQNLVKAGLVEGPAPGLVRITPSGQELADSAEEQIDQRFLVDSYPSFAAWHADRGIKSVEDEGGGDAVWMVRAGKGGLLAHVFVERALFIVGWGSTGDVAGLPREELASLVTERVPDVGRYQHGQAVNTLYRIVHTMSEGDLVITPEPRTRTLLLGRVSGGYSYLPEPVVGDYQHAREVKWFARVSRDELSYGARNSLGSLLTLTRPSHQTELQRLAALHENDPAPEPVRLGSRRAPPPAVVEKVPLPSGAVERTRIPTPEFQTYPRRILDLLVELHNGQLALPDFQRTFVWSPDATKELIVSIIRSFPAGALLFLRGGSSSFKARAVEGAPPLQREPMQLVLDGQQRLTSLYQAVYGVGQSRFFLDMGALIAGADVDEAVRVHSADQAVPIESLRSQADALIMPLSSIRTAHDWRDSVVDLRRDLDQGRARQLLREVADAFIKPIEQYAFPVTDLPPSTELEAVCTIFETLNRTGKPLTPFELISARAFAGGVSLYELWGTAREVHPILEEFGLEPYYVLQVIALRTGRGCKRGTVLSLTAEEILEHWYDAIAHMAAAVCLLRDECGVLLPKWLPYRPMLIPLAAAWLDIARATGPSQGAMRTKLKKWFWCACFTGEYESASAGLVERDAPVLRDWLAGSAPPPVVQQFTWDPERWRSITSRQQGLYRATIALTLTQFPRDFHTAAPLTVDAVKARDIDDHHVFPRAFLRELGRRGETDSVLNHALIDRTTNTRIGKRPPSDYLAEIRSELGPQVDVVLESHLLPVSDEGPFTADNFDAFLAWRLERLAETLAEKTDGFTAPTQLVSPRIAKLDAWLERVELAVRVLIVDRLAGDLGRIPPHLAQKADERLSGAAIKTPGEARQRDLPSALDYLDLPDLKDIIVAKLAWPEFADIFGRKDNVARRFDQITEIRNAIRHSRPVSDIMMKDGEAALLWFDTTLPDQTL